MSFRSRFSALAPRGRAALIILAVLAAGLATLAPQPSAAQSSQRCFPETGYCISGSIRAYWERNGGLAVFGYPISTQHTEVVEGDWSGPVQWFERDRLEDHSNARQGVLAGRLGARYLEFQGRPWIQGLGIPPNPACRSFNQETGYAVCGTFRSYWERNGGLARFGYPITDPIQETVEGREYTVQYFERRRMELHPENLGTPYEVLLGLLGRDVYAVEGGGTVILPDSSDLSGTIQLPVLDAAWARVKPGYKQTPVAIGLIDVVGDYAWALALPQGRPEIHVYLKRQAGTWKAIAAEAYPMPEPLRKQGVPETLLGHTDRFAVIVGALRQLQDPRGTGEDTYITRPRIAGDFARFWVSPAVSEGVTMFYKRVNGTWGFLTAGSAFPEDSLSEMGVPRELWEYGEGVPGPQA
jgi:hypothetical protein